MIAYNVLRRWFADKAAAESYRKSEGLPPLAVLKIEVTDRAELCALLNALCEAKPVETIAPPALIDRAYVPVENSVPACIPAFLVKDKSAARVPCHDCDCGVDTDHMNEAQFAEFASREQVAS